MIRFMHVHSLCFTCTVETLYTYSGDPVIEGLGGDDATAAYCLQLPGKTLYLTPLLAQKKFRKRGNKDGAVRAFYQLEAEGLG